MIKVLTQTFIPLDTPSYLSQIVLPPSHKDRGCLMQKAISHNPSRKCVNGDLVVSKTSGTDWSSDEKFMSIDEVIRQTHDTKSIQIPFSKQHKNLVFTILPGLRVKPKF